jgi:UDP-N-acetyl-D-mannosaminuronic acid dehydrogenase
MRGPNEHDSTTCVIGLGYVGTSLAVTLATRGRRVVGVERDPDVCRMLSKQKSHVREAGLELEAAIGSGRLSVTQSIPRDPAIDVYVVCVGTPVDEDGSPDLRQVEEVVRQIGESGRDGDLVILRSTVPVGTSRRLLDRYLTKSGKQLELAFCPERTAQGVAVRELQELPQIIAGGSRRARDKAADLFRTLTGRLVEVEALEAAEIAKLACNAFRYTTFAFANELARLCEAVGVSMNETRHAASHGYLRAAIPLPGPSGGSCLPKDAEILGDAFRAFTSASSPLLEQASHIHRQVPQQIADSVLDHARRLSGRGLSDVALLGVAFKGDPETDDERSSPSVEIVDRLRARFPTLRLRSHDPVVSRERQQMLGYDPCATVKEAVSGAQIVVIGNNHAEYADLSLPKLTALMEPPCLIYDVWAMHVGAEEELPAEATYLAFGEGQFLPKNDDERKR